MSSVAMPAFAYGETVVLHTRSKVGEDALHVPIYADTDITISGCPVYPDGSTEALQGGDTITTGLRALVRGWPTLDATAEATVRGQRWTVDGTPTRYGNPMSGDQITELRLKAVTG